MGNVMVTGIFILAMAVVMMSFLHSISLIYQKGRISQLARGYLLRMETQGRLHPEDREELLEELRELGVTDISLEGTTTEEVTYGEKIAIEIQGRLGGENAFVEKRVSTSKN